MDIKSILITGSSGSIGTALANRLLSKSVSVTCVDIEGNPWFDEIDDRTIRADLREESSIEALPDNVDLIVHLAAHSRVQTSIENPDEAVENVQMTKVMLDYAREVEAPLFLGSSREVYGENETVVCSEEDDDLNSSQNPYAASKVGSEALCHAYSNAYDVDVGIFRFSNVYGKFDMHDRVVPIFLRKAMEGEELTVYGGNKILDFVYIDDCVDGIVAGIENSHAMIGNTVNIGSGRGVSLQRLAELVCTIVPESSGYRVESETSGEVSRFVADIEKSTRLLGYSPEFDLEDGLDLCYEWYHEKWV